MRYYTIKPQVPGGFGPATRFDETDGRRQLVHAQIIADSWPEHLFKNVMLYAVSEQLMRSLVDANITGVRFRDCEVVKGDQFAIANPAMDLPLPKFYQLVPEGVPCKDDIARERNLLVISERVKAIIDGYQLTDAIIESV